MNTVIKQEVLGGLPARHTDWSPGGASPAQLPNCAAWLHRVAQARDDAQHRSGRGDSTRRKEYGVLSLYSKLPGRVGLGYRGTPADRHSFTLPGL